MRIPTWVKAAPIAVALPVTLFLASVKPQDAASNIAAWLSIAGMKNIPGWLSGPATDRRTIILALIAGAAYSFVVWGFPALKKHVQEIKLRGRTLPLAGIAACLMTALLAFAGWFLWPRSASAPIALPLSACGSISESAPEWLKVAAKECGQKELVSPQENPRINDYFASLGDGRHHRQDVETDPESDWASPFVEWAIDQSGYSGPKSTEPFAWLKWGKKIDAPLLGSIAVLSFRGLHHVGFFFRSDGDRVEILGGNEDDRVEIASYEKSSVLGYRLPPDNLTIASLKNTTVPDFTGGADDERRVQLKNGNYNKGLESIELDKNQSSYVVEDFDENGDKDIASIFYANGGGSGTFVIIAVFLNDHGSAKFATAAMLGDRVVIKKVEFTKGLFKIDMIAQSGTDPLCCPTHRILAKFRFKNGSLVRVGSWASHVFQP